MDHEVRELLGGMLPPDEPPMPQLNLAAGRAARRRNLAARSIGVLTVTAVALATVVFVANGSARSPSSPPGYTPPPNETPAQVFVRLDRAWRGDIPDGAHLVHVRDDNGRGLSAFGETLFAGYYHLPAPAATTEVNYAVIRGGNRGNTVDPRQACREDASCLLYEQRDGTLATVSPTTRPGDHLVGRLAHHYRADGVLVQAEVYVPGDDPETARFPLTDQQLLSAATDPRLTFARNQVVPTTPAPPPHTAPTQNPPVPQSGIPTLPAQAHCVDRTLSASIGTAAANAVQAKLAELADPAAVVTHPGDPRQLCIAAGADRSVAVEGSTDHAATVIVEVHITSYARQVPTTEHDACPAGALSCQLTRLAGRTIAQYELDTGASNNMDLTAYYSPHVRVDLTMAADGNTSHSYGFTRAELVAIATDPQLVEIARQLAAAR